MSTTFLLALLFAQTQTPSPTEEYQRGKNAFDRGEFARSIEILRPLLYPEPRLQLGSKIVETHRLLGVAYLFQKQDEDARAEFRRLLQIRPDYRLDPLLFPPDVVDFFNAVRKAQASELSAMEAKRANAEKKAKDECLESRAGPVVIEKRLGRNSYYVNFIPFGAGQFQNGHRKKGWAFLTVEATFAVASIGAQVANLLLYGLNPTRTCRYDLGKECPEEFVDHTQENQARWLTRVQVGTGAMFLAAAGWGILDALYHYQPETLLAGTSKRIPMNSRVLGPIPVGDTFGPGVLLRF